MCVCVCMYVCMCVCVCVCVCVHVCVHVVCVCACSQQLPCSIKTSTCAVPNLYSFHLHQWQSESPDCSISPPPLQKKKIPCHQWPDQPYFFYLTIFFFTPLQKQKQNKKQKITYLPAYTIFFFLFFLGGVPVTRNKNFFLPNSYSSGQFSLLFNWVIRGT